MSGIKKMYYELLAVFSIVSISDVNTSQAEKHEVASRERSRSFCHSAWVLLLSPDHSGWSLSGVGLSFSSLWAI